MLKNVINTQTNYIVCTDGSTKYSSVNSILSNMLNIYEISVSYVINANSSFTQSYNANTSQYETIIAVIESTGDNKVIPYRCILNNGNVEIGLQNFNTVDLELPLKIRLLRKQITSN